MKHLLNKYKTGEMTQEEVEKLEHIIGAGQLDIDDFDDLKDLDQQLNEHLLAEPGISQDVKFYDWLNNVNKKEKTLSRIHLHPWVLSIAAALLLVVGFLAGSLSSILQDREASWLHKTAPYASEVKMIRQLQAPSRALRLEAALQMVDLPAISPDLINALLFTVNFDQDANVRLSAIDALRGFGDQPEVRSGLIRSIENQYSPLVIMSLAEALYVLGEKHTVQSMTDRLPAELPADVVNTLNANIQSLY